LRGGVRRHGLLRAIRAEQAREQNGEQREVQEALRWSILAFVVPLGRRYWLGAEKDMRPPAEAGAKDQPNAPKHQEAPGKLQCLPGCNSSMRLATIL
jgi:hypothetical protein